MKFGDQGDQRNWGLSEDTTLCGVWTTRPFLGTQTPSCHKLPQPTSYAVPMRRILSEFRLKVLWYTNEFEQNIKHKRLVLALWYHLINVSVLDNRAIKTNHKHIIFINFQRSQEITLNNTHAKHKNEVLWCSNNFD